MNKLRSITSSKYRESIKKERSSMEGDGVPGQDASRLVHLGGGQNEGFVGNTVVTHKYNPVTFLPIFLFQMFSRVAYLYFLGQAALAWWSTVSPFSPFGPMLALSFVLLVAAAKAILEDRKRWQEDLKMNSTIAHRQNPDGTSSDIKWSEVKVGDVLRVLDGEDFPGDLLCLRCSLDDNVCFIKTTNLDGESNLKIRRPVDLKDWSPTSVDDVMALKGTLHCEPPNPNLHFFVGKFVVHHGEAGKEVYTSPVDMNHILLRGCTLKNSGVVYGMVIYTGPETRIQKNAAPPSRKLGSYDSFLNTQIALVIALQLSLCILSAGLSLYFRENYGKQRYYLALDNYVQGNYRSNFVYFLILFITNWILMSYMVPISLFVTLEVVKFVMAFYINEDRQMRDPVTGESAKARNSDVIEDLGKAKYIFSDKTGTLTSNEMRLRQIAIKGVPYGSLDFRLEAKTHAAGAESLEAFDKRLAAASEVMRQQGFWQTSLDAGGSRKQLMGLSPSHSHADLLAAATQQPESGAGSEELLRQTVLGHHVLDFWTNLCVCHSLILEDAASLPETAIRAAPYQGPSPDEVALVEGAAQLGFVFRGRTNDTLTLSMAGHEVTHTVLNTLDFTSDRGRMSVIARAPDGTIRLYCKGSDLVMPSRLRDGTEQALLNDTQNNLRNFSVEGLRTLVLGTRVLSEEQWRSWNQLYQKASADLADRDGKVAEVAEKIEVDLELLGVTAIEDKLQDGVPEAIEALITAGMKVWMITGDKQETAINIGISCRLIGDAESALRCNVSNKEEAETRLRELLAEVSGTHLGGRAATSSSGLGDQQAFTSSAPLGGESPNAARGTPQPTHPVPVGRSSWSGPASLKRIRSSTSTARELVVDGRTLSFVLGTHMEPMLAQVAVACGAVVVCRASPAQKAAIVRMMHLHEVMRAQQTGSWAWLNFFHRASAKYETKMVAIGDGANDVAMIQEASIGVGILGKEGRQAANNSDYAIAQFRFLVRLLMVHGTVTDYRLSRLIKYSFYKNIAFAILMYLFQFYNGWSGQALLDGLSSAFYNAFFTAFPIGVFALVDRPFPNFNTFLKYPQLYNRGNPLSSGSFWKTAIALGFLHGAVCFFVPYYAIASSGATSITDIYSLGKTCYAALLGAVTLEIALVARYWTKIFIIIWSLSYLLMYAYLVLMPLGEDLFNVKDVTLLGVGYALFGSAAFWLIILEVYCLTFGIRFLDRAARQVFHPNDNEIIAEAELLLKKQQRGGSDGGLHNYHSPDVSKAVLMEADKRERLVQMTEPSDSAGLANGNSHHPL